jgi:two-component system LytT family response regulator
MPMIRAIVVDDEPLARQRLRQLLAGHSDISLLKECANGLEAVDAIEELKPDLVFLDVQMPELDGFGVIDTIGPDQMPAVLFVTAFDQHALKAFEVHALDYLLKPFDRERFNAALDRARHWIGAGDALRQPLAPLLEQVHQGKTPADRILVKHGSHHVFVKLAAIQWVEAEDNYVRLHVEGTSHLLRQTLSGMLAKLDTRRFRRIHRSAIVNLDFVQELSPWSSGDYLVLMKDGTKLTLSRTFREQFGEWL